MDKDEKENTTLTFDEIMEDKEYQAELDRRIQKGIDTAKSNWEEEYSKKQEADRVEQERQAKLSAEEKLAEREKTLLEREKEQNKKEMIYQTKEILSKENLPLSFAELIVDVNSTTESIKEKIEDVKKKFAEEVEIKVKQSLAGNTPKASNVNNSKESELRKAMGLSEKK